MNSASSANSATERARHLVEQARAVLAGHRIVAEFEIDELRDCCLIHVGLADRPGFQVQVSQAVDGWIGILDPHQEDIPEAEWPRFVLARASSVA
ncbi:hypothetical protein [Streptomyces sp. NPDC059452]|uniref:hypothetical protein n=1 Tax=Streptomyces sp. NPDC059452 TaxID=3346835 RepID=UPI003681291D